MNKTVDQNNVSKLTFEIEGADMVTTAQIEAAIADALFPASEEEEIEEKKSVMGLHIEEEGDGHA
jgi:hypothetical protein